MYFSFFYLKLLKKKKKKLNWCSNFNFKFFSKNTLEKVFKFIGDEFIFIFCIKKKKIMIISVKLVYFEHYHKLKNKK